MLRIKNNKLSTEGIQFTLPDNFYIDIEGMEGVHPDGLHLLSVEEDCIIGFITTEIEFDSPVESLLDIFMDDVRNIGIADNMFKENETGYIWIEEPQMRELNGLKCAIAKYHTKYSFYYEIHFERIEGYERQFEVLLEVPKKCRVDLETVLSRENIKAFYNSFELLAE